MWFDDMPKNTKAKVKKKHKKTKIKLSLRERMLLHKWKQELWWWEILWLKMTWKHTVGTRIKRWANWEVDLNQNSYYCFLKFMSENESKEQLLEANQPTT